MDALGKRAAAWVRQIRSLFSRRFDDELADEMRMHQALRRQALIDGGMDPREAEYEARRLFGNTTVLHERSRDAWDFAGIASFWRDLVFGARLLVRHPAQSGAIVLTIALGAGLNAALFLAVNAVFFRPPDIMQAHEVIRLDDGKPSAGLSYPDYVDYRDRAAAAVDLAAFASVDVTVRLEEAGRQIAESFRAGLASGNYFDVLGVRPIHGRTFTGREDLPSLGTAVVVLGEVYWARRFNRDPGVVGRSIELNRRPFTVIGVVPASFRGVDPPGGPPFVRELWVPLWTLPLLDPGNRHLVGRTTGWGMQAVGRLRPGVSLDQARAQIGAAAATLDREFAGTRHARAPWISPITDIDARLFAGPVGLALAGFGTVTLLVLLIASANVAGLLLARASARSREIAIRQSLGAGRLRIVRQFLTEGLILSLSGITLGMLAAYWVLQVAAQSVSQQPLAISFAPDSRVLGYSLALAAMVALATGLVPALQASKMTVLSGVKEGAARGIGKLRAAFVVSEVAVCLVLLVATALLLRSVQHAHAIDIVIPVNNLLSITPADVSAQGYDNARATALFRTLQRELDAVPGVSGTALANPSPFSGNRHATILRRADAPDGQDAPGVRVFLSRVSPSFFAVASLPIVRGRVFEPGATEEVVVSETLARRLWGSASPLDARVISGDFNRASHVVVGIVRDAPFLSLRQRGEPFLFRATESSAEGLGIGVVLARTLAPASTLVAPARAAGARVDSNLTFDVAPLSNGITEEISAARSRSLAAAAVGGLALLLSLIGIGAVAAQTVINRTHEIGVRMALGARSPDAVALVVRSTLAPVAIGLVFGTIGAALVTRVLSSQLYGLSALDPAAFAGAVLMLFLASCGASWIPARRAARVDPIVALRAE